MKRVAQLSAVGIAAVLLVKLLSLAGPLFGLVAAAFSFALKILLVAGAAWLVWSLLKKSGCCGTRDDD